MDNKAPNTHVSPKTGQNSESKGSGSSAVGEDSFAFLKSLTEVSSVFVGFTFIGGWIYLASYYSTFGLNPLELDSPVPVVCATAVYILYSAVWPLLVVAAFSLGWIFFSHHLKDYRRRTTAALLAFLLLTASVAGVILGQRNANDDMLIDSSELPNVAFSSKLAKTDQPNCVDHETYGTSDCKLLLHSKGTYYFFTPVPKPREALTSAGSLNVYTLADSDVTGVHILRGLARNAEEK